MAKGQSLTLQDHKRNLVFNSMHETFWGFGVAFHSVYAVIPLFLKTLGAPPIVIGSVAGVFTAGAAVPQILTAFFGKRIRNIKVAVMSVHSLLIPPILVVGLIFAFISPTGPHAWLVYFVCYILYTLSVGIVFPIWADFLETVHIPEQRGTFFGVSFAFTSGAGLLGGLAVKKLLASSVPFPANFGYGFLIYSACIVGAIFIYIPYKTRKRINQKPTHDFTEFLREIRSILSHDKNFRHYLFSRMLLAANYPAISLYAVYTHDRLGFDVSEAGIFTAITVVLAGLSSYVAGKIGDRFGHKHAMALVYISYLLALVTALAASSLSQTYLIFIFLGLGQGGFVTSAMSLVFEFAGEEGDKKIYFALIDTLTAPFVILFIVLTGVLIPVYGIPAALVSLGVFVVLGISSLILLTKEPKTLRARFAPPKTLM